MFNDLPVFVTEGYCLTCDGCCRFSDAQSSFRPRVSPSEQEQIPAQDCVNIEHSKDKIKAPIPFLKTISWKDETLCLFFQPEDHLCRIYPTRPFECRLYPFLLRKKYNDIVVSVHLSCPFVQERINSLSFERYVDSLKKYLFKEDVLDFLRKNAFLAGDYTPYEQEIKDLFILKLGIRP